MSTQPSSSRRREPHPGEALVRAAVPVAALATAAGLHQALVGGTWFVQAVLAAGVVTGVSALTRRLSTAASCALQGAALLVLVTVLFVPGQALAGLVPGPAAWSALHSLLGQAHQAVVEESAPAPASPALRLLTTGGTGLATIVADVLAVRARRPALTGMPLLAIHVTAAVLAPGGISWPWFALAGAGFALLLAADAAQRAQAWGRSVPSRGAASPPPLTAFGGGGGSRAGVVVALAVAVAAPMLLPATAGGFSAGVTGGSGQGSGNFVDPLIDLRSNLRSRSQNTVLSYRTSVQSPQPLRIVTVDTFDGQVWRPAAGRRDQRRLQRALPAAPGLSTATSTHRATQSMRIEGLREPWLPLPYPSTSVSVDGDWTVDAATLNVAGAGRTSTAPGQEYSATYLEVTPTSRQLASSAPPPAQVVAAYGAAPRDLAPSIAATARTVVGAAGTEYAKAVALQDWFRDTGGFTYSTKAPPPRSASALADFLKDKRGYCVHFASAMAIMARTLGIPARVAIGFLPGTQLPSGRWSITLADAHAWPELYFSGVGWVRFEPTPGERTGVAPGYTVPSTSTSTTSTAPGSVSAPAAPAAGALAPVNPDARTAQEVGVSSSDTSSPWWSSWALWLSAALLSVAVAALPVVSRILTRRRRRWRARGPGQAAEAAWADLLDSLADLGVEVGVAATPRQVGTALGARLAGPTPELRGPDPRHDHEGPSSPEAALARLVLGVESSRYGATAEPIPSGRRAGGGLGLALAERPQATSELRRRHDPDDVRVVVRALAGTRPRSARWRERLLPASGLRQLREGLTRAGHRGG